MKFCKLLFLQLLVLLSLSQKVNAQDSYDIASGTSPNIVYYNADETNKTAEVTYKSSSYGGYQKGIEIASMVKTWNDVQLTVTSIGERAFHDCSELTALFIPETVTRIADDAFTGCTNLRFVTCHATTPPAVTANPFPSGVEIHVLEGCKEAYENDPCWKQCTIVEDTRHPVMIGEGYYLLNDETNEATVTYRLLGCNRNTYWRDNTIIPSSVDHNGKTYTVTAIGDYAMEDSYSKCIVLPGTVTTIGEHAFRDCKNLKAMVCYATEPPTAPSDMVGELTLTTLYVAPNCVDDYQADAVWGQIATTIVAAYDYDAEIDGIYYAFHDGEAMVTYEKVHELPYTPEGYRGNVVIPSTVEYEGASYPVISIGDYAFYRCGLESVDIPSSVKAIGKHAFEECQSLTSIVVPGSVATIGEYAFYHCSDMVDAVLMNGVTTIGDVAFSNCSSLLSVTLPRSLTTIGARAFEYNEKMTTVNILAPVSPTVGYDAFWVNAYSGEERKNRTLHVLQGGTEAYKDIEPWYSSGSSAQSWNTEFGAIVDDLYDAEIDGVCYLLEGDEATVTYKTRGEGNAEAYQGSVVLPSSVTYAGKDYAVTCIGGGAFQHCSALTSLTLPASLKSWGTDIFEGVSNLSTIVVTTATPLAMTTDDNPFLGLTLANIDLGFAAELGEDTPYGYAGVEVWKTFRNMADITLSGKGTCGAEGDNMRWYVVNGNELKIYGEGRMADFNRQYITFETPWKDYQEDITSIEFYGDIEYIGNYAFEWTKVTSVSLPATLTAIGNYAFVNAQKLTTVNLSETQLTSIGNYAFSGCASLNDVSLPASLVQVGTSAFAQGGGTLTLRSLPQMTDGGSLGYNATISLDLTDSEKPFMADNLTFSHHRLQATYSRSLEPGKWGTIVLPFVPDDTEGLAFYTLKSMDETEGGWLIFEQVETVEAGVPYLFKNASETAAFTLTMSMAYPETDLEATNTVTTVTKESTKDGFTMKGTLQIEQFTADDNIYFIKDNLFYLFASAAPATLTLNPFRGYFVKDGASATTVGIRIDGDGSTLVESLTIDDGNGDAVIYDLLGRRVDQPTHGIYIVNGKKVIKR